MYLSEVGKNDGGFNYVMKSHSLSLFDEQVLGMPEQVYWSESELLKLFPKEHLIEVYGSAGDMIFADTKGIHKEGNATENDRMVIIANFVLEEEYSGKVVRQKVNEENFANLTSAQQQALQYFDIVPHEQFN